MEAILQAFRGVFRNRDLRRVQLAYVGFNATECGTWVAILVYAYERGGATEASLVAVVQLIPGALLAAPLGVLVDRYRPVRVLAGTYLVMLVGVAATALAMRADAPLGVVLVFATLAALGMALPRPTQSTLVPFLAHSPDELTATNVVSGWVESASALVGTAAAGVLLGAEGPASVFGAAAFLMAASIVLVARVNGPQPAPPEAGEGLGDELLAGIRVLRDEPQPRLLIGMLVVELTIYGALDLLCVVLAIDLLGNGSGWAGYLNAAFAAGGAIGSVGAALLVGRRRLAPAITGGMLVWGAAFVVIAAVPSNLTALLLLAVGGIGRSVLDVGSRTLLQRTTPSQVLGRVFGLLEALELAGLAVGALIVPPLVALGGPKAALVGTAALMVLAAGLAARPLAGVDRGAKVPVVEIALLRATRLFGVLPAPALEGVAHALEPVSVPAGTVVIHEGDLGDRYYVVASGGVDVAAGGVHMATLGRGEGFGEIALLEDVPRTATVSARGDARLYALEREPFLTAITGHAPSEQAASDVVAHRRRELAAAASS